MASVRLLRMAEIDTTCLKSASVSKAIENLQAALQRAMAGRPLVAGFPYLAETLRRAGVTRNIWFLPACESLYFTQYGPVVMQGTPLVMGAVASPAEQCRRAFAGAARSTSAGERFQAHRAASTPDATDHAIPCRGVSNCGFVGRRRRATRAHGGLNAGRARERPVFNLEFRFDRNTR